MFCHNCGYENAHTGKFCQKCGTSLQTPQKKRKIGKIIAAVCCIVLIIGGISTFVLDQMGWLRIFPKEMSDCLGKDWEEIKNKYHMKEEEMDSGLDFTISFLQADNVTLCDTDKDEKIDSFSCNAKSVFCIYGITCGMTRDEVKKKLPSEFELKSATEDIGEEDYNYELYRSRELNRRIWFQFSDETLIEIYYSYGGYDFFNDDLETGDISSEDTSAEKIDSLY